MNYRLVFLAVLLTLGGCTSAAVQSDAPPPDPAGAAQPVPQPAPPPPPPPSAEVQQELGLLGNRITAVQERLLQLSTQTALLQEQGRQVLQQLQIMANQQRQAVESAPAAATALPEAAEFNNVLDQITLLANEISQQLQVGSYRIASSYTQGGKWVLIRYDRFSGESWFADAGQWQALEDLEQLPPSDYEVLVLRADKDLKGYVAARIDRQTGQTWWLKQNSWQRYE